MSSLDQVIHSDNFTDENGELHYLNTGRDNVSGLHFPNHYVRNSSDYSFTRVLNIKLSTDTSLIYPIHECFLLTTFNNDNVSGVTNIITVDAIAKEGTVKASDIKVTCTPLNHTAGLLGGKIHTVYAAIKGEPDANGNIGNTLGIWVDTKGVIDFIIKDLSSLAYNEIPNNIYHQFLQCNYESHYLNNEDIVHEVNMFNVVQSIGSMIAQGDNVNQVLIDRVKTATENISVPNYQFLSVVYDDMYSITDINTDEIIKPVSFQYVKNIDTFATIADNYVHVNEEGNYIIALKVNMDALDGNPTKMTISLYLNDDKVQETTSSVYLDPSNKVYPLGFLAGQCQLQLKSSDKLYLKARWTEKGTSIENHCTLQITRLN
jgi:hypothetical protein